MKLKCEKEYKCPHCKKISDYIDVCSCGVTNYYICPKCGTEMFYSIFYIENISWELNISKKEGVIYYDKKEVETIEVDENKELVFKYK